MQKVCQAVDDKVRDAQCDVLIGQVSQGAREVGATGTKGHVCRSIEASIDRQTVALAQWAIMSVTVSDNPMGSRYEARIDGVLAGISEYELTPDTIIFLHTVVAEEYEGQGVGTAIARYALDDARARDFHVRPLCPFIRAWMQRHPEYADLIPTAS
jgi:predicted GNAT family acetyltransferase